MRPQLETLESRIMADAALANLYLAELAPLTRQVVQVQQVHNDGAIQQAFALASAGIALVGPQYAATHLPALVAAADALTQAAAPLPMAEMSMELDVYQFMYNLPSLPNEAVIIDYTVATLQRLESQL